MDRQQELEAIMLKAREELDDIAADKALARNRKLVGSHFKYRNSYSCPQEPSDYWWLYSKVTGINGRTGALSGWAFQTDKNGRVEVEERSYMHLLDSAIEIDADEFNSEYGKLIHRLRNLGGL